MSRGKPGHCRASLISKHGTSISSCHCIFAPTAPVTAVLRNFPLYHQTAAEGTPLCSSLSYLHIWGRPHHFGRIPPAVNMPRPNKSSFSPVFRKSSADQRFRFHEPRVSHKPRAFLLDTVPYCSSFIQMEQPVQNSLSSVLLRSTLLCHGWATGFQGHLPRSLSRAICAECSA